MEDLMPVRLMLTVALLTLGVAPGSAETGAEAPAVPSRAAPGVRIDGHALDFDAALRPFALQILRLESQLYALQRRAIDEAIAQYLLEREAARRSTSVRAMLAEEVDRRIVPPTEAEVDARLARRASATDGTAEDVAEMRTAIRASLVAQRRAEAQGRFVAALRESSSVRIEGLEPPTLKLPITTDGEPSLGPREAPVTIVEFSDFQCPHCRAAQETLKALLRKYGGKVRLVHRDFPVPQLHPGATAAAEAARCADEQDTFWPYQDLLYANPTKQAETDLVRYAEELGLDSGRFQECVRQRRHAPAVARGMTEGRNAGVVGTPTFFVNGIPLVGARPLSEFAELIERELSRRRVSDRSVDERVRQ
jgi:protein-disulfide isomerase